MSPKPNASRGAGAGLVAQIRHRGRAPRRRPGGPARGRAPSRPRPTRPSAARRPRSRRRPGERVVHVGRGDERDPAHARVEPGRRRRAPDAASAARLGPDLAPRRHQASARPSACAMPAPSVVRRAAPRGRRAAATGSRSSAAAISSPVPRVVVSRGSRRGGRERARGPRRDAISTIASRPSARLRDAERGLDRVAPRPGDGAAERRHRGAHPRAPPSFPRRRRPSAPGRAGRRGGPTPSGRHRLRRLTRRERASELVGGHEDAHPADATIPRRTRRRAPGRKPA